MKSNVLLQSESRELLGRNISVMSKDGFVCITEVMEGDTSVYVTGSSPVFFM